jgi:hypothetical protein
LHRHRRYHGSRFRQCRDFIKATITIVGTIFSIATKTIIVLTMYALVFVCRCVSPAYFAAFVCAPTTLEISMMQTHC